MRVALALSAAAAGLLLSADALADRSTHIFVHRSSDHEIDANNDSWVTREEAAAAAERTFSRMDRNSDGRLTEDDHAQLAEFDIRVDVPEIEVLEGEDGDRIRIIRRGADDERVEREIELAERARERAEREAERAAEHAERAAEQAERMAEEAERRAEEIERRVERRVLVMRDGEHVRDVHVIPPVPPVPPIPPHPPMLMMLFASADEADLNGDGGLSLEEFRAQQLRFFDASDANGDGRIRLERPPEPPEPPVPPRPPR
jgi:hypothetical protein